MPNKLTQEEFISRSNEIHKGKYDYSKVIYDGYEKPVTIICPIHGEFQQTPHNHIHGRGCQKCAQEVRASKRRIGREEFIKRSNEIHNFKYDYSLVDYKNNSTKVKIICPKHGVFEQVPANHLWGNGCPMCKSEKLRGIKVDGYVNDYDGKIWDNDNKKMIDSYTVWRCMMNRCDDNGYKEKFPTYKDVYCCKEWHSFKAFKQWFDKNYVEGWALDKDLLVKGNKCYSPETCCFLPREINNALTYKKTELTECVLGVNKTRYGKYESNYHRKYLGLADTEIEMFNRYKKAKEDYLKELAEKYKNKLSAEAYNALYNYKIEITDKYINL